MSIARIAFASALLLATTAGVVAQKAAPLRPQPAPSPKAPLPAAAPVAAPAAAEPATVQHAAEACRVAIAIETVRLKPSLQNAFRAAERWQAVVKAIADQAKPEAVVKAAADIGIAPADVARLTAAKETAEMKKIADAELEKAKPEIVVADYKARIDKVCETIHAQIKAELALVAAQTRAETEGMLCDNKVDMLARYLDLVNQRDKRAAVQRAAPRPKTLTILSARMGEFSERQTCDAWPYIRKECGDFAKTNNDAMPTYCIVKRDNPNIADFCGYDPAPREAKQVVINYSCGSVRQRPMVLRADSKFIRIMCDYPSDRQADEGATADEAEIAKLKKTLVANPCPVTGLPE